MFQPTLEQVRRALRIVSGFTLLALGAIMLITPGPGWVTIFFGLSLLAAEFVWARRLMNRIKREEADLKKQCLALKQAKTITRPNREHKVMRRKFHETGVAREVGAGDRSERGNRNSPRR